MKRILIKVEHKNVQYKKKQENKILWFDIKTKTMKEFNCGKIEFQYSFKDKKTNITPKDAFINTQKTTSNKEYIYQVLSKIDYLYNFEIDDKETNNNFISLTVSDKDYDDLYYYLEKRFIQIVD